MEKLSNVLYTNLSEAQKNFLAPFGHVAQGENDDGAPIYAVADGGYAFIEDFVLTDSRGFEKGQASEFGLYYGCACVFLWTSRGIIATYDYVDAGYKPSAAGIAKFEEGGDLSLTALREFTEKLYPVTLGCDDEVLLVPYGTDTTIVSQKAKLIR
ncbi:MAG: hypothetical protein LBL84_01505 [Candidatus Nomurabacteria bacterium]|nr:hypothetical protein [Candidatus Nomurabacteria bacterium]